MTAVALIAENVQIGTATPPQRAALIEVLVNGPLYKTVARCWISRPSRTLHNDKTVAALVMRNWMRVTTDGHGGSWARLTRYGTEHARSALAAWVAAADALVNDAALNGLSPLQVPTDLAARLDNIAEWGEEIK